jgi:hypothetical protein
MSDYPSQNPFQSPAPVVEQTAKPSGGSGDRETVKLLKQTQPWALTIAIVMCLAAALMVLGGIAIFGMSVTSSGGQAAKPMMILGIVYPLMAILYIAPAVYLFKYSSGIGKYTRQPSTANLNLAIRSQKSFWKFCGITLLVVIGLYLLLIPIVLFGALSPMQ